MKIQVFKYILLFGLLYFPNKNDDGRTISSKEKFYTVKEISYKYETIYKDLTVTVYHPVKKQTDGTPFLTADHSIINPKKINKLRWIALSRDLIYHKPNPQKGDFRNWKGKISFGDTVMIESKYPELNGLWVVHDTMNKRYTNSVDLLQDKHTGLYGKWKGITIKKKICKEIEKQIEINS